MILASYPLCLEWLPSMRGEKQNMVIVGSFMPEIEIWDLNAEVCEPRYVLGGLEESSGKKKKKGVIKQF